MQPLNEAARAFRKCKEMVLGKVHTKGMARRQAMLDAATALFLEKGFEATSLSDIVERSRGSRTTLYEQFGNKEGLLRAMIAGATERVWQTLDLDSIKPSMSEDNLFDLGMRFVRASTAPDGIAMFRVTVAESHRLEGLANYFHDLGPRLVQERLSKWFSEAMRESDFGIGAPKDMARVFVGAVAGDFFFRSAVGITPDWDEAMIVLHVRTAVRIFLDGVGRPSAA